MSSIKKNTGLEKKGDMARFYDLQSRKYKRARIDTIEKVRGRNGGFTYFAKGMAGNRKLSTILPKKMMSHKSHNSSRSRKMSSKSSSRTRSSSRKLRKRSHKSRK